MSLNIGGDKDDIFYRYKMPPIMSKIEGKGNGIKTVVPNMAEIAKALNRPAMYPCKFFGTELGAQTKHETKNDRYIINGAHEASKLQELLGGFIQKFVLCTFCKNPETVLKLAEGDNIMRDCAACGRVSTVDMRHKLSNYMLNHPTASMAPNGKGGIKSRRRVKPGKTEDDAVDAEALGDASAGDKMHKQFLEDAKNLGEAKSSTQGWCEDKSAAPGDSPAAEGDLPLKKIKKKSSSASKKKQQQQRPDADAAPDEDDPFDQFAQFALAHRDDDADVILAELARTPQITADCAAYILPRVLVELSNLPADLRRHMPLFVKLVESDDAKQQLLGGFERLVAENDAHSKVAFILQQLYEGDAVDDEAILKWGEKPTKRYTGSKSKSQKVRDAAAEFLEWLQNDEEGEDEDDE